MQVRVARSRGDTHLILETARDRIPVELLACTHDTIPEDRTANATTAIHDLVVVTVIIVTQEVARRIEDAPFASAP